MGEQTGVKNNMRMFKNRRGLSPIFATLILIAIAVIAGIVVYMFTSGYLGSSLNPAQAGQEKAAVQGVGSISTSGFDVYMQYVSGGSAISINGAIVRNSDGTTVAGTVAAASGFSLDLPVTGALQTITVTATLTPGTYTVSMTSAKGGSFTSPSFVVPAA
jgi:archaeal type IV pilus assembly protein PilA